jgi:hypothetical protein
MDKFESHLLARYERKINNDANRYDRTGNKIQFLLTLAEFRDLFSPYENDVRFYDSSLGGEYLCVARNNDLGNYEVGNVKVITMRDNSIERNALNDNRCLHEILQEGNRRFREHNPHHMAYARSKRGENITWKQDEDAIKNQKNVFREINHQKGKSNSQYGTCWIYSLSEKINKKIPIYDLSDWEANGWIKGRKMSF